MIGFNFFLIFSFSPPFFFSLLFLPPTFFFFFLIYLFRFCVNVPICHTRSDAVSLGNKLLEFHFIAPAGGGGDKEIAVFSDADDLFELSDPVDVSSGGRIVLNLREGQMVPSSSCSSLDKGVDEGEISWNSEDPQDMMRFSRDLLETMGMLFSQVCLLLV